MKELKYIRGSAIEGRYGPMHAVEPMCWTEAVEDASEHGDSEVCEVTRAEFASVAARIERDTRKFVDGLAYELAEDVGLDVDQEPLLAKLLDAVNQHVGDRCENHWVVVRKLSIDEAPR